MTLLTNHATAFQKAMEAATKPSFDLNAQTIKNNRYADTAQAAFLPWLAWETSISDAEGWQLADAEQVKRNLIATFIQEHQIKGTPAGIHRLFKAIGLGEIDIVENTGRLRYDAHHQHQGRMYYGGSQTAWATYYITFLAKAPTNAKAKKIQALLKEYAPARCHLFGMHYGIGTLTYNRITAYDGEYNFGSYL